MPDKEEFDKQEPSIELPSINEEKEIQKDKKIIEIPQEYYDKLKKEQLEKERLEALELEKKEQEKKETASNKKLMSKIVIHIILIFASIYATLNFHRYFIFFLPFYIIVASIFFALKEKKNSDFPVSILLGGIFLAIISFVLATIKEDGDLWMYYTVFSIIVGFLGLITANRITWFITERKNIKALQTIGFLLYFVLLIGIPFYLYKNFREDFIKIVFREQPEVKAETEIEFIEKTLKYRYGETFTCREGKNYLDEKKQRVTIRECTNEIGKTIEVNSTAYNESKVLYTVTDNYMNILYLDKFKESLEKDLNLLIGGSITIRLYPETKCSFVGDCVECDEYILQEKEEKNKDNLYENSSKLNLEKYKNFNQASEFVNEYKFKYVIRVVGQYGGLMSDRYEEIVDTILKELNDQGLKNTFGYEIVLRNSNELNKVVHKVKGTTNKDLLFKDPILDEIK